jgi:hypothetical protein
MTDHHDIAEPDPQQPPVPITVWHCPAARPGETLSAALAQRLLAAYTSPHDLIVDLTTGGQLGHAAATSRRLHHHTPDRTGTPETHPGRTALIVTGWPPAPGTGPGELFRAHVPLLAPGGCLAVVLGGDDAVTVIPTVIITGRAAGLTYLQHLIAAHDLTRRRNPAAAAASPHLRVHTDVLIFRTSRPGRR